MLYLGTYAYTTKYMHARTTDVKSDHAFDGVWGGVYGRVWDELKVGKNIEIKMQCQK